MGEPVVFDRWDGGLGWMADRDEPTQRTSHALVEDGSVFLVDPVEYEGLDDLIADLGEVVGVVRLLDRHQRDSVALANRYDVPIYLPGPLGAIADDLEARTSVVEETLSETGYRVLPIVDRRFWREAALFDGESLVVPEAVGTSEFFTVGSEPLGVHVGLRLFPPRRQLGGLAPQRVLVGHGEGIMMDATKTLQTALAGSRRTAPRLFVKTLRMILTGG